MGDTMLQMVAPLPGVATTLDHVPQHRIGPIRIGPKGRVVLPVEVRRALGVGAGDELVVLLEEDSVNLMTREAAIARIRAAFGEGARSPLEDLMELRRVEREREARRRETRER